MQSQNPYLENSFLGSKYLNPDYLFSQGVAFLERLFNYINSGLLFHYINPIITLFTIFFLSIICYTMVRMIEIRHKERKHLQHEIAEYAHHHAEREGHAPEADVSQNEQWRTTLHYLLSQNTSDWKLAIIEADSMLEGLLDQLGFKGETLGDRLKSANQERFPNLASAWEVHTVRNRIAHEGLSYQLSQHEAKRVIAIYEEIFRQYGLI